MTFFRDTYLTRSFELQAIFHFTLLPMLDGFAKFALLMFLFIFFIKSTFNVNLYNILFSFKGRISRMQYWFMIFIISALTTPMLYSLTDTWLNLNNVYRYNIPDIYFLLFRFY